MKANWRGTSPAIEGELGRIGPSSGPCFGGRWPTSPPCSSRLRTQVCRAATCRPMLMLPRATPRSRTSVYRSCDTVRRRAAAQVDGGREPGAHLPYTPWGGEGGKRTRRAGGGGGEAGGTGAYAEGERGAQSLNFSRRPGTRLPPPSSPLSPGRYAKATQDPHPTGYRALTRCSLLPRTRLCSSSRSPKCSQTTARMPPLVSQLVSS
jgi:hypothetical protein